MEFIDKIEVRRSEISIDRGNMLLLSGWQSVLLSLYFLFGGVLVAFVVVVRFVPQYFILTFDKE